MNPPDNPPSTDSAQNPDAFSNTLRRDEWEAAAALIHESLVAWYEAKLNQGHRFGDAWEPFLIFPEVYEALDPDRALVRRDGAGDLTGICFYHPRPTHVAVGIVATRPGVGGRGVARSMMEEVTARADAAGLPVRLVSSLLNLDSFSLYTKLGFVPGQVFQDMQFPPGILPPLPEGADMVRPAVMEDLPAMVELEQELCGLDRTQDFRFFLENTSGYWHTMVLSGPDGALRGFLGSVQAGGMNMLGPGVMRDEDDALALITAQLHHHAPGNPVFLVPARAKGLVAAFYQAGARNVELHVAQVRGGGPAQEPGGIVIPTFLPESG